MKKSLHKGRHEKKMTLLRRYKSLLHQPHRQINRLRKWCDLKHFQTKCPIYFSKCVLILRKIDFHFSVKSVKISYPILVYLVSKHRQPSDTSIKLFRQIRHSKVSIFHKICYEFWIFSVILKLAVIFNFFCLLYCIRIHLYYADPVSDQLCSKTKPIVPGGL